MILSFPYRKNWANKGYFLINDLFHIKGKLLPLKRFQENGLEMNHLNFVALKYNFNKLTLNSTKTILKYGSDIPTALSIIVIPLKGC